MSNSGSNSGPNPGATSGADSVAASGPSSGPSPANKPGFRIRYRWFVAGAAAFLALAMWFVARDPDYQFQFAQVSEQSHVERLGRLFREIRQVEDWQPQELTAERIKDLADWIRFPSNANATSTAQLYRGSTDPKFATLRGMLSLLPQVTAKQLQHWRTAQPETVQTELQHFLSEAIEQHREGSFRQAVRSAGEEIPLEQLGLPAFPETAAWSRRLVRGLWRQPIRDGQRWVKAFQKAFQRDVEPISKFYSRIAETRSVIVGAGPECALVLRSSSGKSAAESATRFRRENSTSTWELWFAEQGDGRTVNERSTGILFHNLPWQGFKLTGGAAPEFVEAEVHPAWPPPAESDHIALKQFELFLNQLEFPRLLHLSAGENACEINYVGDWTAPRIELRVKEVHWGQELGRQESPWQGDVALTLAPNSNLETLRHQVATQTEALRVQLAKHVTQWEQFAGFPVKVKSDHRGPGALIATVHPAGSRPFSLRGEVDQACQLTWEPLPQDLRERRTWIDQVSKADSRLTDWKDRMRLRSVQIEPATNAVLVSTEIPHPAAAGTWLSISGKRPANGELQVVVPEIPSAPIVDPAPKVTIVPGFTAEILEQTARQFLSQRYPNLAPFVDLMAENPGSGPTLRCGLRIGDWPALELGPAVVSGPEEVPQVVERLLSEDAVKAASSMQWHPDQNAGRDPKNHPIGWRHLRLDDVTGIIKSWQPGDAQALIDCRVNLGTLPLNWDEKLRLATGTWTEETLDALQQKISPQVALGFSPNDARLPEELQGLLLKVRAEPGRFGPGRWLRMKPLAVALRGEAMIPCFQLGTATSVLLDHDGFHIENISVSVPGTIPLPYMAMSDPRITLDFKELGMTVDAKFTPPVLTSTRLRVAGNLALLSDYADEQGIRVDNPWLHAACLHASLHGRLKAPSVEAGATLQTIGSIPLAQGLLRYDIKPTDFTGELTALRNVPWLKTIPLQLGGRAHFSGQQQFFLLSGGVGQSNSIVHLNTSFRWADNTPLEKQAQFDGHVRDPVFGAMFQAGGHSDAKLQNYLVHADGTVGPYFARLEADPHDVRWTWGLRDYPHQTVEFSAPAMHLFPEAEIRQKLEEFQGEVNDQAKPVPASTAEEERFVAERFQKRPPVTNQVPTPGEPNVTPVPFDSTTTVQIQSKPVVPSPVASTVTSDAGVLDLLPSEIYIRNLDGQLDFFRPNGKPQQTVFAVPMAQIGFTTSWRDCDFWLGQRRTVTGGSYEVLIHEPSQPPRVWHVSVPIAPETASLKVEELSQPGTATWLAQLLPSCFTQEQKKLASVAERERKRFIQELVWECFFLREQAAKDISVRQVNNGYQLEYLGMEHGKPSHQTYFVQWRNHSLFHVNLPRQIEKPQHEVVSRLLERVVDDQKLPKHVMTISAVHEDRIAGWSRQDSGWSVYFVSAHDVRKMPLSLVGLASPEECSHHKWGQAALRTGAPPDGERTFFGSQAFAVAQKEDAALWFCRVNETSADWCRLTRSQFTSAAEPVAQRLPGRWRTAEQRRRLAWDDVATAAVDDWKNLRKKNSEWGVNPLLMLTGLTKGAAQ